MGEYGSVVVYLGLIVAFAVVSRARRGCCALDGRRSPNPRATNAAPCRLGGRVQFPVGFYLVA